MKRPYLLVLLCVPQTFIDSLDTKYYYQYWLKEKDEKKVTRYLAELQKFRATNYGRVPGESVTYPYNKDPVTKFLETTTFLGLPVKLHQKVIPQLKCVEQEILGTCQKDGKAYIPKTVSGYRSWSQLRNPMADSPYLPASRHNHEFTLWGE